MGRRIFVSTILTLDNNDRIDNDSIVKFNTIQCKSKICLQNINTTFANITFVVANKENTKKDATEEKFHQISIEEEVF